MRIYPGDTPETLQPDSTPHPEISPPEIPAGPEHQELPAKDDDD